MVRAMCVAALVALASGVRLPKKREHSRSGAVQETHKVTDHQQAEDCQNVPGWSDSSGFNCTSYEKYQFFCEIYGHTNENNGHTASTACCTCAPFEGECNAGQYWSPLLSSQRQNGVSGAACEEACKSDPACLKFTSYDEAGKNECYFGGGGEELRSSQYASARACAWSQGKCYTTEVWLGPSRFYGSVATREECAAACAADGACFKYQFVGSPSYAAEGITTQCTMDEMNCYFFPMNATRGDAQCSNVASCSTQA